MGKHLLNRKVSRNVTKFGKCNLLFFLRPEYRDRGWEKILCPFTSYNYYKIIQSCYSRKCFIALNILSKEMVTYSSYLVS